MAARLVVLALFVAGCQSWTLPAVNQGRRAQFYTQKSDGAYQYGFDTAEGLFQEQQGDSANEVRGQFGADGGKVEYTAGVDGFVVTSLKKADAAATKAYISNAPVRYATLEELATHPKQVADTAEVAAAKASFKAAYDAAAAAAEAAPDTDIITGAAPVVSVNTGYTYSAPAVHTAYLAPAISHVRYSGPVVTLDASGRVEDTAEVKAAKASFKAAYNAAAAAAEAAPDTDIITAPVSAPAALYSAPTVTRIQTVQQPTNIAVKQIKPVEIAHVRSSAKEDGSYEFSYETSDSSRHESADAANNVYGNFEFVADDAQRRRVEYQAGAETGFIASGAHLPVSVADTAEVAAAKASFKSAYESAAAAAAAAPDDADVYSAPAVAVAVQPKYIASAPLPVITTTYTASNPSEIADFRSTSNTDGSYQFSYSTSDSSRHESADAANNVYGNFEFVADDAQRRRVEYQAGAETGFIASGAHLPVSVADTAEVAAAKASFRSAYESAAAAAEAAPDTDIITGAAPVVSVNTGYTYSAPAIQTAYLAPATSHVRYSGPVAPLDASGRVKDTAEVKAAKASFRAAYDAAAAAAEAAPDINIITGTAPVVSVNTGYTYSAPAIQTAYLAPAISHVRYSGPVVTLDASGRVKDTAEVKAAKASFKAAYDAAAAAAEAAPDVNIITGAAPVVAVNAGYTYSAPAIKTAYLAPAVSVAAPGPVVTLDASGRVEDTAEVKAAKASFKAAYAAAAAAAEAAPDTDIITAPVAAPAALYSAPAAVATQTSYSGASQQTKAAHHGGVRTYSFDGITLMQADGPAGKFGYSYE